MRDECVQKDTLNEQDRCWQVMGEGIQRTRKWPSNASVPVWPTNVSTELIVNKLTCYAPYAVVLREILQRAQDLGMKPVKRGLWDT